MTLARTRKAFLLLALSLMLLPATADAAYATVPASHPDPCSTPAADHESAPDADDCCDTGCQHCSLPCCAGTAMIPTAAQSLDAALSPDGRLALTTTVAIWVDADPLYHPPRS